MSHYNNGSMINMSAKQTNNELSSFEKAVMSNAKESIENHLSKMKIDQTQLNYALFLSIQNFKLDQYADECILILLRHKANPNSQLDNQTALTLACRKEQQLIVKALLQNGAKPDLCNKRGQHPLSVILADKSQNYDVAKTLISHMTSVNFEIGGQYPIILSIQREFFKIFQLLIEKGSALTFQNETVLHIIAKKKFKNIQKKKKFIKQLAGRLYLMAQDSNHKLPIQYEEIEEIRFLMLQNFKPKIIKQEQLSKSLKDKQLKQRNNQARRLQILKQFQYLELHLEDDEKQKNEKESETDSEESFQGSFVNLNEQIYQLVNKLTLKNQEKAQTIQILLKYIQSAMRKQLEKDRTNVKVELYVYGSQSTGLCIQQSDVDVLVVTDFECGYLMRLLEQKGTLDIQGIIEVKFISGASMPVIKLQTNQKFRGMCVDLTFQTRNHMGLKCAETIKAFMEAQVLLRPLTLVIKVLVNIYGLSDPYKGGLGSYAITLMVIALLQFTQKEKKQIENVGELLLNFFYFYGEQIDYVSQAIIIHDLGLFGEQPVYCIYRLPYFTDLNPKLIIYDPLNPVNNVGRTTYRIAALKKLFSVCYLRLKQDPRCQLKDILDGSFSEMISDF